VKTANVQSDNFKQNFMMGWSCLQRILLEYTI